MYLHEFPLAAPQLGELYLDNAVVKWNSCRELGTIWRPRPGDIKIKCRLHGCTRFVKTDDLLGDDLLAHELDRLPLDWFRLGVPMRDGWRVRDHEQLFDTMFPQTVRAPRAKRTAW